ncbi:hypothetical protein PVAP13_6NG216203 [Panicum virgatum]|uniref:Uncharacterized protein n=1 Tax=Panicum virgatum TaxID=38727 RepID=A0A8T0R1T5_PANVG|nr:hypothetical protein PVAP13_6NG216203 [Panicum virgatum]
MAAASVPLPSPPAPSHGRDATGVRPGQRWLRAHLHGAEAGLAVTRANARDAHLFADATAGEGAVECSTEGPIPNPTVGPSASSPKAPAATRRHEARRKRPENATSSLSSASSPLRLRFETLQHGAPTGRPDQPKHAVPDSPTKHQTPKSRGEETPRRADTMEKRDLLGVRKRPQPAAAKRRGRAVASAKAAGGGGAGGLARAIAVYLASDSYMYAPLVSAPPSPPPPPPRPQPQSHAAAAPPSAPPVSTPGTFKPSVLRALNFPSNSMSTAQIVPGLV